MLVIQKFVETNVVWRFKEHIGGKYGLTIIERVKNTPVVSCNSCTGPAILEALQLNKLSSGCYTEFGVFRGGSFAQVLTVLEDRRYLNSIINYADKAKITKCYGFDSFEGFPAPINSMENMYSKGTMRDTNYDDVCNIMKSLNVQIPYELIKGFFSETLPSRILEPISVCLVDCDSYTSSLQVLNFIYKYMQNSAIIVFDDYNLQDGCQKKAIEDFLNVNKNIKLVKIKDVATPEWTVPIYEWQIQN